MSYAVAQQEYVRKASDNDVTTPDGGSWLSAYAIYLGATEPNGTWVQTICELLGVTQPLNGSWVQALANFYGITTYEPFGNWWLALADGATPLVSWVLQTGVWRNGNTIWTANGIWNTI